MNKIKNLFLLGYFIIRVLGEIRCNIFLLFEFVFKLYVYNVFVIKFIWIIFY